MTEGEQLRRTILDKPSFSYSPRHQAGASNPIDGCGAFSMDIVVDTANMRVEAAD